MGKAGFWRTLLLLASVMVVMLGRAWLPGYVLSSNDGPLGGLMAQCHQFPERFLGCWSDLNSVGGSQGAAAPAISTGLLWLLKPVLFSKFYASLSLLLLGLGAWCFLRQSGLSPPACLLGGLAAALSSSFFSAACWGLAMRAIAAAMVFFALAALVAPGRRRWLRVMLAGFALGMSVTEVGDIGALFSLFVAAFVMFQAWISDGPRVKNMAWGAGRVVAVAICAAAMAAQALSGLVATNIQGIAGTEQDTQTKAERWDWATQWSLPKAEALSLIVPGLFGYRMDTPDGGMYWGRVGRTPAWERYFEQGEQGRRPPRGFRRYSGDGPYAGVVVVLLAVWAAAQSLRGNKSAFSRLQRRWLWFWLAAGLVSLLLAFGRFAPFYRLLYGLPYFSTIRNPNKFLLITSVALVVLFAYGVDALWRGYLAGVEAARGRPRAGLRGWWAEATVFDKRWVRGCLLAIGVSLAAWLIYALSRQSIEDYLMTVGFAEDAARAIAGFSLEQAAWFVLFLALAVSLMILMLRGVFAGPGASRGAGLLCLLVAVDLGHANLPWVVCWNYKEKYATNPILDELRDRPYEHRVTLLPFRAPPKTGAPSQPLLMSEIYRREWLQHQFLYYNIQALDVVQMSRVPEDLAAFRNALRADSRAGLAHSVIRYWQLTNTRYLLGAADARKLLDQSLDSTKDRFKILRRFSLLPKHGISQPDELAELTAVPSDDGPLALFEFTGALPRAKLYSTWQANTNDEAILKQLDSSSFDPQNSVFVSGTLPAPTESGTNPNSGTVEFVSYAPKLLRLQSDAISPCVLLLNDRFNPDWKVRVDGKPERLLRCNFLMRGVLLSPGRHAIEFEFRSSFRPLFLSLGTLTLALLCLGLAVAGGYRDSRHLPTPGPAPQATSPTGGKRSQRR
jgi:hypothetical protein